MQRLTAYAEALAPVFARMLEEARIAPGERVLDVGCGAGDMALLAAESTGASGFVLATDASLASMAGLARRIETSPSPRTIAMLVCAAEELALEARSFDVALARNCVMYFRDLDRAIGNVRRALRTGGRFVVSVYGPPAREPFHAIPIEAVSSRHPVREPAPDYVQAFRVGAEAVRAALATAGFTGVCERVVPVWRSYPDLASALESMRTSASLAQLLSAAGKFDREDVWAEIAKGFSRFQGPDGLRIPGEQVVIVGTA
jgi:SAM-dependent methyltransferase